MAETPHYGLYVTDDVTETFASWRSKMNGTSADSNISKIDSALNDISEESLEYYGAALQYVDEQVGSVQEKLIIDDAPTDGSSNLVESGGVKAYVDNAIEEAATFIWGDEEGEADADWFKKLKAYLISNSPKASWVGKTKSVTLTTSVLGTTTHLIQCIGVNQDGVNTVTFQTKDMLTNALSSGFGSNARWIGSYARQECQNYYNAFPGKDSIKTVSKGTCPDQVSGKNGTATYNNETVFLLSATEAGFNGDLNYSSLSIDNSTTSNSECVTGYNAAYTLYTNAASRIKKKGDSGSADNWWLRSRFYRDSSFVCYVYKNGAPGSLSYSTMSCGLAPAFVIGNNEIIFDDTPTEGSSNPVTSDGIYQAIAAVQDGLVIDDTPTDGSANLVKSGGVKSYVDGSYTIAGQKSGTTLGTKATAEGKSTTASGRASHAEGGATTASGNDSHAEGESTTASGEASHAEGYDTVASGVYSHAEGFYTMASGDLAHAEGEGTTAKHKSQHVFGEYNVLDTEGTASTHGAYVEIVGNGTSASHRSNARTLDWSGNEKLAGKLTLGAAPSAAMDAATKQYVDDNVSTKSTVAANPALDGTEAALTALQIDDTKYKLDGGSDKVGDIKISVRTDLGDNWHECDGTALSFASCHNLQGLVPLTLENSELIQTSLNSILDGYELSTDSNYTGSRAPIIKFLNGYYVCAFTVKYGTDGQNVLYAYSQTLTGNWTVRVLDSQIANNKKLGIIDVDYLNGEYVFTCGYYNPFSLRIYHATNLSGTFTYKALLNTDCDSGASYTRDYNGGITYGNGYYVAYANFKDEDGDGLYYLKRTASLNSTGWESFEHKYQARCSALYFDSEINKFVWTSKYAKAGYTSYEYIYARGISDSTTTQIARTEDYYTSITGNRMKKLNGQYIVYPSRSPSASDTENLDSSVYPVPNYQYISRVSKVGSWIEDIDGKLYSLLGKKGFAIRDSNSLPGTITEGKANELIADDMLYSGFITKEDDFICIIGMTTDGKIGKWVSSGRLPTITTEGAKYYIKVK